MYSLHYIVDKGKCELCDGLIIFEDNILIFEVKSANHNEQSKKSFDYNDNLKKVKERLEKRKVTIENDDIKNLENLLPYQKRPDGTNIGKPITYVKNKNTKYFYIACIDDVIERQKDIIDNIYQEENDIFIFDGNQHFLKTLKYCNTISDFVNYLEFSRYIKQNNYDINNDQCLALFLYFERKSFAELENIEMSDIQGQYNKAWFYKKEKLKEKELIYIDLDLNIEKILAMIENEKNSLQKIDIDIIKNGIYKDISKNEKEQEEFCRYFAALDRFNRMQHCEQINEILSKGYTSPCGYAYNDIVGNTIGFLYLTPNYTCLDGQTFEKKYNDFNKIKDHLKEVVNRYFMKKKLSKEELLEALKNLENIEKFICVNYTNKTFYVVKRLST